jgi:hypothetical protein
MSPAANINLTLPASALKTPIIHLSICILTPAFYTRMLHDVYDSLCSALYNESKVDTNNRTVEISVSVYSGEQASSKFDIAPKEEAELDTMYLSNLLEEKDYIQRLRSLPVRLAQWRWKTFGLLRRGVALPAQAVPSAEVRLQETSALQSDNSQKPIASRGLDLSFLDLHSLHSLQDINKQSSHEEASRYRRKLNQYFIAQRYFWGYEEVVGFIDIIIRFVIIYFAWYTINAGLHNRMGEDGWLQSVSKLILLMSLHLLEWAKG